MNKLPLIVVSLVIALGNTWGQTSVQQLETIATHLRLIDASKDQLREQDGKAIGQVPTEAEVGKYLAGGFPKCPIRGQYLIRPIGADPEVSISLRSFLPIVCDLRDNYSATNDTPKKSTTPIKPKRGPRKDLGLIPQAEPVIQQFKAVIKGDIEMLMDSYSKQLQERITKKHTWQEVLTIYREAMSKELGDYSMTDFSYSYRESDSNRGSVRISFKGKSLQGGNKRVVLENGKWKVNEK
jgi:hypothetical protein